MGFLLSIQNNLTVFDFQKQIVHYKKWFATKTAEGEKMDPKQLRALEELLSSLIEDNREMKQYVFANVGGAA